MPSNDRSSASASASQAIATSLESLHFSLRYPSNAPTLTSLLTMSSSNLLHLRLEELSLYSWPAMTAEIFASLVAVAPRLHSFALRDYNGYGYDGTSGSYNFDSVLAALRDVRMLELAVHGYTLASIFAILQPLQHLSKLKLDGNTLPTTYPAFAHLTPTAAANFLVQSSSIRYLTLPQQLDGVWTGEEMVTVKRAAQEQGVKFELA